MTSPRKIAANRRNALRSTGPRTKHGKERASRNALVHGLTARRVDNIDFEKLVTTIANQSSANIDLVRDAVSIEFRLDKIRAETARLFEYITSGENTEESKKNTKGITIVPAADGVVSETSRMLKVLARLERYEREALSQRKRILRRVAGAVFE